MPSFFPSFLSAHPVPALHPRFGGQHAAVAGEAALQGKHGRETRGQHVSLLTACAECVHAHWVAIKLLQKQCTLLPLHPATVVYVGPFSQRGRCGTAEPGGSLQFPCFHWSRGAAALRLCHSYGPGPRHASADTQPANHRRVGGKGGASVFWSVPPGRCPSVVTRMSRSCPAHAFGTPLLASMCILSLTALAHLISTSARSDLECSRLGG